MKKAPFLTVLILTIALLGGCGTLSKKDVTPALDNGSFSATVNGTKWEGAYCAALAGGTASNVTLAVIMRKSDKEVKGEDAINLGINNFKGVGTYTLAATAATQGFVNAVYQGVSYQSVVSGTIKITESTAPASILSPGKVVGEITATIKVITGSQTLTITNGKFTAIRVL
ncbi:MAG: hypothetical protein EAZ32_19380 [Cytophagia bacterium]|nr:MAG: hypothetical protein EAZ67_13900 [Cytophagales bacterium]TAG24030.1 MAG: hypothetical protein EAZ38_01970 [Cytophagales bacterium]TAG34709.1 MAG: hypothetical protein EAZ32_19380 [Cytophagia bacterium]TAG76804.1 MAG: hypothetical protein EAZ22_17100 [Cytophagales bacterium]